MPHGTSPFDKLEKALATGNLADAKSALSDLRQSAPARKGQSADAVAEKIEALGKAVDSGDLQAARSAMSELRQTESSRQPGRGAPSGGPQGAPPSGGPPPSRGSHGAGKSGGGGKASESSQSSASGSSSDTSGVDDEKDANHDGVVSPQEEMDYILKQPDGSTRGLDTRA